VADGAVEIFRELLVLKGVHQLFSLLLIICCLETVGREVPIQVGSPEGGVSPRVFLNLRRTHKYRNLHINHSLVIAMQETTKIGGSPSGINP
jgi:hypothetical protein